MHSLLGAIMCSQDYNYGQSSYGRCTATGCRCPSMLYLLSGAECTCSSRRGVNRWPDSGRVLYACAPRYSKALALRMQCVRNTERNRAPLSRFLGFNMTCMAGADREPFWLPRKACMPVQMTVSQNRVKPVHLGLDLTGGGQPPSRIEHGAADDRRWRDGRWHSSLLATVQAARLSS